MPALVHSAIWSANVCAVSATMGTCARGPSRARMRRVASSPSTPGIRTSMRMTSKSAVAASSTAAAPPSANVTPWPAAVRKDPAMSRFIAMSSTTRIRSTADGACSGRRFKAGRRCIHRRGRHRQLDPEHAAAVGIVLVPDAPAHEGRETGGDRKAQAGALDLAADVGLQPLEILEQAVLVLSRYARTGVGDLDPEHLLAGREEPELDPAVIRELDRVAKEVEQDLAQPGQVGGDGARHIRRHGKGAGQAPSPPPWAGPGRGTPPRRFGGRTRSCATRLCWLRSRTGPARS